MSISAGLVGLPNVGKSTLFNALTKSSVPAENYPFCTIDPHVACTFVPDERLNKLKEIYKSEKIIPTTIQFVDIAGLVKGAASGEGLGNQFLSNIREVNLILHVLRCFEDADITYSRAENIDPLVDYDIIMTELMLKDYETITKRLEKINQLLKAAKNDPKKTKELTIESDHLNEIKAAIDAADLKKIQDTYDKTKTELALLSPKKFLIIANVSELELENDAFKNNTYYKSLINRFGADLVVPICAKIEYELTQLSEEEQNNIKSMLNIKQMGLDAVIAKTYQNLDLITFFTCGPKEIHAWTVKKGSTIRQAAGEIHSDLERGFICAEIFNAADLIEHGSIAKLRDLGKLRTEGQNYIVQDGDIVLVKFNV